VQSVPATNCTNAGDSKEQNKWLEDSGVQIKEKGMDQIYKYW
jgi:hypothetical protein